MPGGLMKPSLLRITAVGLLVVPLLAASQPAVAAAATPDQLSAGVRRQLAAGVQVAPKQASAAKLAATGAANPYLALVQDPTTVDYSAWNSLARTQGATRASQMAAKNLAAAALPPLIHDEAEPA